jgi:hypothetical protein
MLRSTLHAVLAIGALVASMPARAQTPVNRAVAVNRDVGVKIWVPAGSLRIIGWDRDSLRVEGTVGKGDTFYFGGAGSGAKLGVEEPAGRTAQPAHLTIHLPRGANVSVRTVTASTEASDVSGWFNTVAGDIRVSGTASEVQAEAIDGSIYLTATTPLARARTGSGTLSVGGRVEDLIASTVSGPLTVTSTGLARGRFESMTGPIVIAAPIDRSASIDVDNHNGSVELRLPSTVAADFDLTSVAGSIVNSFDKRPPTTGRQGRGQELSFYTDPKGARIVVRTFKGTITLGSGYIKVF